MVYRDSCEEHKYLAEIRKEKESFERLIKERAVRFRPVELKTSNYSPLCRQCSCPFLKNGEKAQVAMLLKQSAPGLPGDGRI